MTEPFKAARSWIALALQLAAVSALVISILTAVVSLLALGAWSRWGEQVSTWLQVELGIAEMRADIARALGEDRVIRMPEGQSYVIEPVGRGDVVQFRLVIERTRLGAACRFIGGRPLFQGEDAVDLPGEELTPIRQAGVSAETYLLFLQQPERLQPGRVILQLALEYRCGSETVFETTDPVIYRLDP